MTGAQEQDRNPTLPKDGNAKSGGPRALSPAPRRGVQEPRRRNWNNWGRIGTARADLHEPAGTRVRATAVRGQQNSRGDAFAHLPTQIGHEARQISEGDLGGTDAGQDQVRARGQTHPGLVAEQITQSPTKLIAMHGVAYGATYRKRHTRR
jgi:hypothetical protein